MNRPLTPASDAPIVAPADILLPATQALDLTALVLVALHSSQPSKSLHGTDWRTG